MVEGTNFDASPKLPNKKSEARRRSSLKGQFSQKKISADLAHLDEIDDSPSRSKSRQARQ